VNIRIRSTTPDTVFTKIMKKFLHITAFNVLLLLFALACKKGDRIEVERNMRFRLDAFFPDTSVFQSVFLNDTVLANRASVNSGSSVTLANVVGGMTRLDSARLKVTIVKKSFPNIEFDSVIYLSNLNDFLLFQLDPLQKPIFINKRIENASRLRPGGDSVAIRFFFASRNGLINPNISGRPQIDTLNVRLFTLETAANGTYSAKSYTTFTGIVKNQLSEYFVVEGKKIYAMEFLDARARLTSAAQRSIQKIAIDETDGFVRGNLELTGSPEGKFQTFLIRKAGNNDFPINAGAFFGDFLFSLD
jgi:hypothetical protein